MRRFSSSTPLPRSLPPTTMSASASHDRDGAPDDEKAAYKRASTDSSDKHESNTLTPPKQSFFARLRSNKAKEPKADDEKVDLPADLVKDRKKVVPVGFTSLFRCVTDSVSGFCLTTASIQVFDEDRAAAGCIRSRLRRGLWRSPGMLPPLRRTRLLISRIQPLMSLLFGNTSQDFVTFGSAVQFLDPNDPASVAAMNDAKSHFLHDTSLNALYLVFIGWFHILSLPLLPLISFIGIGVLVATYVYMLTWTYTGELNAKRIRERYLKAVLRQDIAYFDTIGAGEIATRIQTDTRMY